MRFATRLLSLSATLLVVAGCARRDVRATHEAHRSASASTTDSPMPRATYSLHELGTVWRDQRGATLELADIEGRARVVALVYTSCEATCPLIVGSLKRIEASVPAPQRKDLRLVLVTLDPDRDTPERLAQWGAATGLDPARWTLLTGSGDAVRELAAALGVRYARQPGGATAHTNVITVLDREGAIVHQQTGLDASLESIAAVARLVH